MLVLTRLENEDVVLIDGDKIIATIKVSRIEKGKVRLGFEAPKEIRILRKEVYVRINDNNPDGSGVQSVHLHEVQGDAQSTDRPGATDLL